MAKKSDRRQEQQQQRSADPSDPSLAPPARVQRPPSRSPSRRKAGQQQQQPQQPPKDKPEASAKIARFERHMTSPKNDPDWQDEDYDVCDIWYVDRLTGAEIMRYDAADPANRPPLGPSDADCLAQRGYNIDEEISVSQSRVPVTQADVQEWAMKQAFKSERQEEFRRGEELLGEMDLFTFLGVDGLQFSYKDFNRDEQRILKPALEAKGFTLITFSMGDQDSFGPLTRVVRAVKDGRGYIFMYG